MAQCALFNFLTYFFRTFKDSFIQHFSAWLLTIQRISLFHSIIIHTTVRSKWPWTDKYGERFMPASKKSIRKFVSSVMRYQRLRRQANYFNWFIHSRDENGFAWIFASLCLCKRWLVWNDAWKWNRLNISPEIMSSNYETVKATPKKLTYEYIMT